MTTTEADLRRNGYPPVRKTKDREAQMGQTFQKLLDEFVRVRDAEYRNDPEQAVARMDSIEYTIQTMLEILRDRFEAQ